MITIVINGGLYGVDDAITSFTDFQYQIQSKWGFTPTLDDHIYIADSKSTILEYLKIEKRDKKINTILG